MIVTPESRVFQLPAILIWRPICQGIVIFGDAQNLSKGFESV
jgi:hypothetical protein